MPRDVEVELRKAGRKKGLRSADLEHFVYGTMTKMQERGSIAKWRPLAHKDSEAQSVVGKWQSRKRRAS